MAKLSSSLKNMALSLTVVAVLAAFVLGLVHNLTAEPIAKAKNQAEAEAIYKVVGIVPENNPFADSTYVSIKGSRNKLQVFPIRRDGLIRAFAIKTNSRKGFGGNMVGITIDGYILGYEVLKSQETPGLGTKVSEEKFKSQFDGMRPEGEIKVKQDGGDIDAVTAATISSRAVAEAVQNAYGAYQKLSSRGGHNE
ncbi:MAG: RnfABCDGE type electron transport complex subunit G [Pseudomonadota bacterium]|nr:RnfABCDGE type electron transport complex subunit G [Pseudomonadota bacterium]